MPVREVFYVPNNSDMRKHMMSDAVKDPAVAAARDVMAAAIAFSPEHEPGEKGAGDGTAYQDHFSIDEEVVVVLTDGGFANPRRAAAVVNDAEYAQQVEFGDREHRGRKQGGEHGAPARPLGRAGAFVGDYKGGPPG